MILTIKLIIAFLISWLLADATHYFVDGFVKGFHIKEWDSKLHKIIAVITIISIWCVILICTGITITLLYRFMG